MQFAQRWLAKVGGKRRSPGEHLVQDAPQRVQVGASGGLPFPLLGCHVRVRARMPSGTGDLRVIANRRGDAEVADLDPVVLLEHEQVGGLDVAVEHAFRVGGGQRLGGLGRVSHGLVGPHSPGIVPDDRREVLALEEFHHDEERGPLALKVVYHGNPRMLDPGENCCLAAESRDRGLVESHVVAHHLDRDIAPEVNVVAAPYRSHAASGHEFPDLVLALQQRSLAEH